MAKQLAVYHGLKRMENTTDDLIRRLIANARLIQSGRYGDLQELFHFTKSHIFPENISLLAEAFGLMAVKLEAREYNLEQTIVALQKTSEELKITNAKLEEYNSTLEKKVKERTEEIAKMAATDDLTSLASRKEILRALKYELTKRKLEDLALLFFDIDHFKDFNDRFGHQTGDEVLRIVGKTVKQSIRASDSAGRYGGEEFLVVLPESGSADAFLVSERVRKGLSEYSFGDDVRITASFGIVSLKDNEEFFGSTHGFQPLKDIFGDGRTSRKNSKDTRDMLFNLLLRLSDEALYKAKKSRCRKCGFESEKVEFFKEDICGHCGSPDIEKGRNRIKLFKDGAFI